MKQPRSFLIPLLVIFILSCAIVAYVAYMPSLKPLINQYYCTYIINDTTMAAIKHELQEIAIDDAKPNGEARYPGYGFTFAIRNQKSVIDKSNNRDASIIYAIDGKELIVISNPDDSFAFSMKATAKEQNEDQFIRAYVDHELITEYEYWKAAATASIKDITLFDNQRNMGLSCLLRYKTCLAPNIAESIYEFQNQSIKGFLTCGTNGSKPSSIVMLFSQESPDRCYPVTLINFEQEEVLRFLSSIEFE